MPTTLYAPTIPFTMPKRRIPRDLVVALAFAAFPVVLLVIGAAFFGLQPFMAYIGAGIG